LHVLAVRQIEILRPRLIIALGGVAADVLLGRADAVARLRARVHRLGGIPLVVTYHPAAMLRKPEYKRPAWEDLKLAMRQWTESEDHP
jgi:DNA polymerase